MIEIKVEDEGARRLLQSVQGRIKDRRPLMRRIAGIMRDEVAENFEAEGRPKWKPSKRALKEGGKTLQDTGRLARSVSQRSDNDRAIVGTNTRYAAIQHFGSTVQHPARERILHFKREKDGTTLFSKARRATYGMKVQGKAYDIKIPARPFLRMTPGGLGSIRQAALEYLIKGE